MKNFIQGLYDGLEIMCTAILTANNEMTEDEYCHIASMKVKGSPRIRLLGALIGLWGAYVFVVIPASLIHEIINVIKKLLKKIIK